MKLCPVILAGGSGTRLWPLSREQYPKQFLPLFGDRSLLQETLLRMDHLDASIEVLSPLLVCNENHRFMLVDQCTSVKKDPLAVLLEPEGRNTAPALTASALFLLKDQPDCILIMMPADQMIACDEHFMDAIAAGYQLAQADYLVTFGLPPRHAETGYGYVQAGSPITGAEDSGACVIQTFTEKPDRETAEEYIADGSYYWNSGIFMMKASLWCAAIQQTREDIYQACDVAVNKGSRDGDFFRLDTDAFLNCPNDSIDFAVMEKLYSTDEFKCAVVPLQSFWSDVGSWSAVWELGDETGEQNVIQGDVLTKDTENCLVRSGQRLVVVLGCKELVVVETADAVLVADKQHAQDVKDIVALLKEQGRDEHVLHRQVHRPWGSYETIDAGKQFQVKRLIINPGKKLSLQSHNKRAEHWVVVNGIATVTRGEDTFELHKDESTYIPIGTKHRLENATTDLLEIIEVQSGEYLGEDDIIRYDDDFGRA